MRELLLRGALTVVLLPTGLILSPAIVTAQEGHEEEGSAAVHQADGEHQEHAEHEVHEKNEIAMFVGGTRRLKFEEDETGLTFGLEYGRQIFPGVMASIGAEWSDGAIERDWIALLKLGVQPFDDWAHPFYFFVGTGIEVGSIDEVLLEDDEHADDEAVDPHSLVSEPAAEGENDETEVDAVMRLGVGWVFHVGSFSIVPNINTDIVGEDWALVGGVTFGYRF